MQVLLRWNVQRGVAVIPKASSPEHMRANIEGLFDWRLSYDQKVRIDILSRVIAETRHVCQPWPSLQGFARPIGMPCIPALSDLVTVRQCMDVIPTSRGSIALRPLLQTTCPTA